MPLAALDKKDRHEIRRKWRRAESTGEIAVSVDPAEPAALERFVELHQARFGDQGLFPATEGGARSRRFVERLAELERAEPDGGQLRLVEVRVAGQLIFTALSFEDAETCFLYNAGMDPGASHLSPGVVGAAAYIRDRLAVGMRRFDFLRGDEPYKYEWGARDEVIERLLVVRQ
jgi:CelD/BcsL family acetyltransferase involved in cellulose biosynthesis